MTDGDFDAAVANFTSILHTIPLLVVSRRTEEAEIKELVNVCREYLLAVRLEITRRNEADPHRQCLLSAYFTKCKIQPVHLMLGLKGIVVLLDLIFEQI